MTKKKRTDTQGKNLSSLRQSPKFFWIFIFFSLLLILIILLFYNQFITLKNFVGLIHPFARWLSLSDFMTFLQQYGDRMFSSTDKNNFLFIFIISCLLIIIEFRKKVVQNVIQAKSLSHKTILGIIILFALVSLRFFYAPGKDFYRGDSTYFIYLSWLNSINLKNLIFLQSWNFLGGAGQTLNQFYSPLFSIIAGIINALSSDIYFAIKITNLFFRILCAIGIYLFLYELTENKKASFLAAISSLLIHQLNHSILYPGRYSAGAALGIIPFLFYYFEKFIKTKQLKNLIYLSLFSGILLLTHLKSSVFGFFILGLYIVFRLFLLKKFNSKIILLSILPLIVGLILANYIILGFQVEKQFTGWGASVEQMEGLTTEQNPFISHILWNNYRIALFSGNYQKWQSGYLGTSILIIFLASLYFIFNKKEKNNNFIPLIISTFFIFILTFVIRASILFKFIPFLNLIGDEKPLMFLTIFSSMSAGIGFLALSKLIKKIDPTRLFIILTIIILIDLIPTTFQAPYSLNIGQSEIPIFNFFKNTYGLTTKKQVPNFRIMLAAGQSQYAHDNWRNYDMWLVETDGIPNMQGHYIDSYYKNIPFILTLNNMINNHNFTLQPFIPEYLIQGVYLLYTGYMTTSPLAESPFFDKTYNANNIKLCQLKYISPIVVSKKLKRFSYKAYATNYWNISTNHIEFLKEIKINMENKNCNFIPVADSYSGTTNLIQDTTSPIQVELLETLIQLTHVKIRVKVDQSCFMRLAFSSYPSMKVKRNGKKIKHQETLEGMILLSLEKGEWQIEIIPHWTKLRIISIWSSLILFIVLILLLIKKGKMKSLYRETDSPSPRIPLQ